MDPRQFHHEGGGPPHQGYDSSEEDTDEDDEPGHKRARKADGPSDRKEKHKVVEQKRREKTKELLAELQDLLPGAEEPGAANFTMNTVLQHAIDFLTARATRADEQALAAQAAAAAGGMDVDLAYRAGFMTSATGIAYAGVDGTILEVNPSFATLLGYPTDQRQKLIGRTLFSLTAPQDMQNTLKAVSRLLSGELNQVSWAERFMRADGGHSLFRSLL